MTATEARERRTDPAIIGGLPEAWQQLVDQVARRKEDVSQRPTDEQLLEAAKSTEACLVSEIAHLERELVEARRLAEKFEGALIAANAAARRRGEERDAERERAERAEAEMGACCNCGAIPVKRY